MAAGLNVDVDVNVDVNSGVVGDWFLRMLCWVGLILGFARHDVGTVPPGSSMYCRCTVES